MEQKKEPVQINVKRVFFYEGSLYPSFELENGKIMEPITNDYNMIVHWNTEAAHEEELKREAQEKAARPWYKFW